jgi:SAM-dependent methyltransferase
LDSAEEYERNQRWPRPVRAAIVDFLMDGLSESARCLILGCATGVNDAVPLARRAPSSIRVVAGDIEPRYLSRLRRYRADLRLANLRVARLDITKDLSHLGTFNLVCLFFVIHRVRNWRPAIRNVTALVAPGGTFCISQFRGRNGLIALSNSMGRGSSSFAAAVVRQYFALRRARFNPELKSSDIRPVLRELHRRFVLSGYRDLSWPQRVTMRAWITKIRRRAYAPFHDAPEDPELYSRLLQEFGPRWRRPEPHVERIRIYRFTPRGTTSRRSGDPPDRLKVHRGTSRPARRSALKPV